VLTLALLITSAFVPFIVIAAAVAPQVLYLGSLRMALAQRKASYLLDAYVQLAQETYGNIGFLHGLWTFRHFAPQLASEITKLPDLSSVPGRDLEKVS
jgi:hypothetical protein